LKKVGLALGSGGARGWAHIGVIEALEEAGVTVSCVAGASMGSLVGGAYAAGKLPVLREFALHLDWKQVLYYFLEVNRFPRSGLIDGTKIAAFVRQQVSRSSIESLPLPFAAVSTDVMTGREVVMKKGDLIEAIRASFSIPGIFTPVSREGAVLVDGGLVNPVPVSVARELGADYVIAVDLNQGALARKPRPRAAAAARPAAQRLESVRRRAAASNPLLKRIDDKIRQFDVTMLKPARKWLQREDMPSVFDVLGNSLRIMEAQIAETRLKIDRPDLLIRPSVGGFNFMEFHRADEAIRAGYLATKEQLAKTPELLKG
jgi:NTE family protein